MARNAGSDAEAARQARLAAALRTNLLKRKGREREERAADGKDLGARDGPPPAAPVPGGERND